MRYGESCELGLGGDNDEVLLTASVMEIRSPSSRRLNSVMAIDAEVEVALPRRGSAVAVASQPPLSGDEEEGNNGVATATESGEGEKTEGDEEIYVRGGEEEEERRRGQGGRGGDDEGGGIPPGGDDGGPLPICNTGAATAINTIILLPAPGATPGTISSRGG